MAKIEPLNDADAKTVWLTLRKAAGPALNFSASNNKALCQALLSNKNPDFSARALKMVCKQFRIADNIARAVIKQVCDRIIMGPRPPAAVSNPAGKPRPPAATSVGAGGGGAAAAASATGGGAAAGGAASASTAATTSPTTSGPSTNSPRVGQLNDKDTKAVWLAIKGASPPALGDALICQKLISSSDPSTSDPALLAKIVALVGQ